MPLRLAQAFSLLTVGAARQDLGWKRLMHGFHAVRVLYIANDDARV